jgi:SAM-dependent methyltransferase
MNDNLQIYKREDDIILHSYLGRCIQYSEKKTNILELTPVFESYLEILAGHFQDVQIVRNPERRGLPITTSLPNVRISTCPYETFTPDVGFDNISLGFILEHVGNPETILKKYRKHLNPGGCILVGVPNALSLHRLLAHKAGLLKDIGELSPANIKLGHKRFWTYHEWMGVIRKSSYRIVVAEGLYLKPFSTAQMEKVGLAWQVFRALTEVAVPYPEIASACFFKIIPEGND